eukprot:678930-Prymnesium_polylepis.3
MGPRIPADLTREKDTNAAPHSIPSPSDAPLGVPCEPLSFEGRLHALVARLEVASARLSAR